MAIISPEKIRLNTIIGANIRREREVCKLTQAELGKFFGWRSNFVSKLESGERSVTVIDLYRLSEIFNISINSFFKTDNIDENNKKAIKMSEVQRKQKKICDMVCRLEPVLIDQLLIITESFMKINRDLK